MLAATRLADGWALLFIIPFAVLHGGARGFAIVACGVVSAVVLALIVHGIKRVVRRGRPQVHGIDLARPITAPDEHAFPSGHTSQAFGMLVLLTWLWPVLAILGGPIAVAVGISRVFFGLHYPSDVAAGALLGVVVTLGVILFARGTGLLEWLIRISPIS